VASAHAEQTKLKRRIEATYEGKLDGVIDDGFYRRQTDECRAEMAKLAGRLSGSSGPAGLH
jgi:hypothetical protein